MPGDHVKYRVSSVYLFFQVNISKDAWDIPVWNLAPSPVPGVVHDGIIFYFIDNIRNKAVDSYWLAIANLYAHGS